MRSQDYIFFLSEHVMWGFALSLLYGSGTALIVYLLSGDIVFGKYIKAYFIDFNCFLSGGLLASTVLLISKTNNYLPIIIQDILELSEESQEKFDEEHKRYNSVYEAVGGSSLYLVFALFLFSYTQFPFNGIAEWALLAYSGAYYALATYVGRKIYFLARIIYSIEKENPKKNIEFDEKFTNILIYVNSVSLITSFFIYMHVTSFYTAPFLYTTSIGISIKPLILVPIIIGTPVVLLFNFYPKRAVRKIYLRAIKNEKEEIISKMKDKGLSDFEKMIYIIEYEKATKEDMNYLLKATLSDFSVFIPIVISVLMVILN